LHNTFDTANSPRNIEVSKIMKVFQLEFVKKIESIANVLTMLDSR
jgi:hypothetical protein